MTVQPGSAFLSLVEVMDRLRSPGGCPWDARQTHESLVEYLVEETYETVEAIETGDRAGLREELGDLLLQVVFHARIAQEDLVGRHPHVFGDEVAGTADEVEANWHARKAIEKGRTSVTDGIPMQLPALVLAAKVLARSVAFTDDLGESSRHEAALAAVDDVFSEEAFGDLLLGLVTIGRDEGWDAEAALRGATRRRIDAIRAIEANDG